MIILSWSKQFLLFILLFFLFYTSSGLVAGGKCLKRYSDLDYTTAVIIRYGVCGFVHLIWWLPCGILDWLSSRLANNATRALLIVPIAAMNGGLGQLSATCNILGYLRYGMMRRVRTAFCYLQIHLASGIGSRLLRSTTHLGSFQSNSFKQRSCDSTPHCGYLDFHCLWLVQCWVVLLVEFAWLTHGTKARRWREDLLRINAMFHPVSTGTPCPNAILAAIMIPADSQLLVSSSAMAEDFCTSKFWRKDATSEEIVRVGRFAVIPNLSNCTCSSDDARQFSTRPCICAWAGFGAAFGPAIVLSLYWSRYEP